MELTVEGLRASGGFSGAPVHRQLTWKDENGALHFDQRPFVVMNDGAFVDLGEVGRVK